MTVDSPNIWVIDDTQLDSIIIKLSIQKIHNKARVKMVSNGKVAIDMLEEFSSAEPDELPHIILLDLNMPVMSGWEFLDQFKLLREEVLRRIHIYIVSGTMHLSDVKRSLSNPLVCDYLHKPLSLATLKTILTVA